MANINNRNQINVNILNESSHVDQTIDEAKINFYTKEEMETVLAPITNKTTAINTELDDFETDLDNKLNKDGTTILTGNLNLGGNKIINVGVATSDTDCVNKKFIDDNFLTINDGATKTSLSDGLNTKLNLSGGVMTGDISLNGNKITNLSNPVNLSDGANKSYTDSKTAEKLSKNGGVMSGPILMGNNTIGFTGTISDNSHLTNKLYVDNVSNTKINKNGDTFNGLISMNNNKITNVATATSDKDCTNKLYVDNGLNSKLDKNGGLISGPILMGNNTIEFTGTITDNFHLVNKQYVDNKTKKYEFALNSNNNYTIEMPFISSTSGVRAFISFSVSYWTQPLASGHTGIPLRKAYYTVELNRSFGLKQPVHYLGNSGDDLITVESQNGKMNIYLNNNTSASGDRGTAVLQVIGGPNFSIGNVVLIDEGDRDTPKLITNDSAILIHKNYVDKKFNSFKSRGYALTTHEVLKLQVPITDLTAQGARWLPFEVKFSALNSSESNTVHFTKAYYHIDVNDTGDKTPVHYMGKDTTGIIKVDTDITNGLATHLNVYVRHTVSQNLVTSVEIDAMETSYMNLDFNNVAITEIPNGGLNLTFPTVPDTAMIVDKEYVDSQDDLKLSLTGGTMSGKLTVNNTLQMGPNTLLNFTANNGRIGGIKDTPDYANDAVNKNYCDSNFLSKNGGTMTGFLYMDNNIVLNNKSILFNGGGNIFVNEIGFITGVRDPVADTHCCNKRYVDNAISNTVVYREGVQSNVVCNTTLGERIGLNDVILPPGNYLVNASVLMRSNENIDTWGSCLINSSFGGSTTVSNVDSIRVGTSPIIRQHNFSFHFRIIVTGTGNQNVYPSIWLGKARRTANTNPGSNSTVEYQISFTKY